MALSQSPLPWDVLFWDLDGTITDPKLGIITSYQKIFSDFGLTPPAIEELLWVIGPPLRECLQHYLHLFDGLDMEGAVQRFRYWYVEKELMYLDTPYPGIFDLLKTLHDLGKTMYVATAKAHPYARQILERYKLKSFFLEVYGSELDGTRASKADLLAWLIKQEHLTPTRSILMIGDREHDAKAGHAHGLTTVGVGYGYGSEQELRAAGVHHFCPSVDSLRKLLLS